MLEANKQVATVHLPAQDPYSDARRRYADDLRRPSHPGGR